MRIGAPTPASGLYHALRPGHHQPSSTLRSSSLDISEYLNPPACLRPGYFTLRSSPCLAKVMPDQPFLALRLALLAFGVGTAFLRLDGVALALPAPAPLSFPSPRISAAWRFPMPRNPPAAAYRMVIV